MTEPDATGSGLAGLAGVIGTSIGLVALGAASLLTHSWVASAGARLTTPEAEKPKIAIADQAEVAYCTPRFKEVLALVK